MSQPGTTDSTRRVAIITGAAEGIGRGIASRLAKDGLDLGLFDLPRAETRLQELAETLKKEYGTKVTTVYGDVSKEDDVKRLVETVVQEHGSLYAMIANAGVAINRVLHETPTEELDRLLNINVKGTFFSYKYAAIQLIKQGTGGRIIGAASIASKKGIALHSAYCATKFAVRGLTQSAAMDYGKYGITVNAYAPGAIETPLLHGLDEYHTKLNGQPPGTWSNSFSNLLGRNGQPEDVAKLVSFLVSDDAAFITGEWYRKIAYLVDGGTCFD
ncbi:acetoin reductase family protein [Lentinus brumalis]|uniref:Acetoin reductase family protein n=1 Tax=Lentinus brumalis TaxID=2498619 RepID=A0A371CV30_9APHY|nr:acetoin reductase family protein [Polyporus brumalis]